ncbi:hypothetical protein BC936DRAFT_137353 [Jimgerdemannia flammicorona]|uniref:Uncharacterized protein n=1 Tax=Jimgerdemannia flammicorona TaxID=994334 RepID=A0A433CXK2_9FUNG|nr:hypothetical protein BC936DRAFT_137353 [Jimgerdemannia flammicorona]
MVIKLLPGTPRASSFGRTYNLRTVKLAEPAHVKIQTGFSLVALGRPLVAHASLGVEPRFWTAIILHLANDPVSNPISHGMNGDPRRMK